MTGSGIPGGPEPSGSDVWSEPMVREVGQHGRIPTGRDDRVGTGRHSHTMAGAEKYGNHKPQPRPLMNGPAAVGSTANRTLTGSPPGNWPSFSSRLGCRAVIYRLIVCPLRGKANSHTRSPLSIHGQPSYPHPLYAESSTVNAVESSSSHLSWFNLQR